MWNFLRKLNRDLSIELGPYLNLYERLINKDAPRSIALAKRTYQRSSINREKINKIINDQSISSEVNSLLNTVEELKKNKNFEPNSFISNINSLKKLLH